MCGCAGFLGVRHHKTRLRLINSLGFGIDTRGGHAAGYVSYNGKNLRVRRKLGHWFDAQPSFLDRAARGRVCMMHARYATCGNHDISEAHPFAIKRKGKIKLYGMHNGMVYNSEESAKKNHRKISVDSEEIFELLADEDWEGIKALEGYGVITWVYPEKPGRIYLLRLSHSSEIFVAETKNGYFVYGSTEDIVKEALKYAGLKFKAEYEIEVGKVYRLDEEQIWETNRKDIKFSKGVKRKRISTVKNIPHRYANYLGGNMEAWLEVFKQVQKDREAEIARIPEVTDETVLFDDIKDAEIIAEDSAFETTCDNCDDPIDEDEQAELDMLFTDLYGSQSGRDTMVCKNCIGI